MLLAVGVLAALVERERSGKGQVVDAAMIDGSALQTAMVHGMLAEGVWKDERGVNLLDGGAPFYGVYETADGGYVSVGAIEPAFYAELLSRLEIDDLPSQYDRSRWPDLRARLADAFAARPLVYWREKLEGTDACFAPVLSPDEAAGHPHNQARNLFIDVGGVRQPAPAPRFRGTPTNRPALPPAAGRDTDAILAEADMTRCSCQRCRGGPNTRWL